MAASAISGTTFLSDKKFVILPIWRARSCSAKRGTFYSGESTSTCGCIVLNAQFATGYSKDARRRRANSRYAAPPKAIISRLALRV